ncbi:MAG: FeoB-associated Cys-rich membrane protein [Clostridia bacterium]|nr:FeoB-associated Cys-rich membrane protein [Clostridia bacterium]
MGTIDYIILLIIALMVGGALFYIFKARKSGQKCIGCPHAKTCSSCNHSNSDISCACNTEKK